MENEKAGTHTHRERERKFEFKINLFNTEKAEMFSVFSFILLPRFHHHQHYQAI